MKRMIQRPTLLGIIILFSLVELSSCSWVSSRRSLFGDDKEKQEEEDLAGKTVSKAQYDELMKKYQTLAQQKKIDRVSNTNDANQMMNRMEKDPSQVMKDLSQVKIGNDLAETVDVFAKGHQSRASDPVSIGKVKQIHNGSMVEQQIIEIRKAEALVSQKKLDAGMTIIKKLESSPVRQIAVRAKYLLGEILFKQGEYDLAMQIYEEVLFKNAFSGLVIKALGRLIVCSEKLKINAKKEKYYSILHDFFEQS